MKYTKNKKQFFVSMFEFKIKMQLLQKTIYLLILEKNEEKPLAFHFSF
jgi:uncharacterized membrane protein YhfC